MMEKILSNSGKIDKIYYCIEVADDSNCRKPNTGMAYKAKFDFPEIDFSKSVIVGDSISDIEFGQKLGMKKILITLNEEKLSFDGKYSSLFEFSNYIKRANF